jgi:hypothetical protein
MVIATCTALCAGDVESQATVFGGYRMLRRDFLWRVAAFCGLSSLAGCGTIMYPERRHQPRSHQIDWKVAALDGLGLLLFFIPGVIAFVVDFYTGAIYLPAGTPVIAYPPPPPGAPVYPPAAPSAGYPQPWPAPPTNGAPTGPAVTVPTSQVPTHPPPANTLNFTQQRVPREELNLPRIEQVVTNHVGQPVSLADSEARVSRLSRLDQYAEQCRQHRTNTKFGERVKNFFKGLRQA